MLPIDKMNNLIKQQAVGLFSLYSQTRIGVISGYDPNTYTAKVTIQPDGVLTNYLPIKTLGVGNQFGIYYAPNDGDMCVVNFQEGDFSSGFISGFIFNSIDVPINPGPPSGETWIVHKTGSFLKFETNGTINLTMLDTNGDPTNLNIVGNVVVTGNITASGDILDTSGTNSNTVKDLRTIYDSHVHPGIMVGGGNTEETTQTM
jgi:phage baseplate assembly protein gpV